LADDLPDPLPFGQVRGKSFLSSRKIYLSQTDGWHIFQALPLFVQWRSKGIPGCCISKTAKNWKGAPEETDGGRERVEPTHQAFCHKVFAVS